MAVVRGYDDQTIAAYDRNATTYAQARGVQHPGRAAAFAAAVDATEIAGGRRLDLGCGPGHHLRLLGPATYGADASKPMLDVARAAAPEVPLAQADLAALPYADGAFAGVWASKAHQHVRPEDLPEAFGEVHRVLAVGGRLELTMFAGHDTVEVTDASNDDLGGGRRFTWWSPQALDDVLVGAGFVVERLEVVAQEPHHPQLHVTATRARRLPDRIGPGMRLLCCGLNPSLRAADAGVGYVTPGNRFWPALRAAGLTTADRDWRTLLHRDHIGMTDLVKRATVAASELAPQEHRDGLGRLERLCARLRPGALVVVGLAGWRAAVDRKAVVGWQPRPLGGVPVYVLPSTSGLNAGTRPAEFAQHFRAAAAGPPPGTVR